MIKFVAKEDEVELFEQILKDALPLVQPEPGTTPWQALRAADDPRVFFVVDLYSDQAALERHVNGPAAALVLGAGRKHLAAEPEITVVGLVAGKDVAAFTTA